MSDWILSLTVNPLHNLVESLLISYVSDLNEAGRQIMLAMIHRLA